MAGSTNKKVVVSRLDREPLSGFVNPQNFVQASGIELLSPSGTILTIPLSEVVAVSFVRDFDAAEGWRDHRFFPSRPKTSGLWLKLFFRTGETLEGLVSNNLMQLEADGFTVVTPQNQKLFVPRAALHEVQVLGVIGSPLRQRKPGKKAEDQRQLPMFES
ncbi:MAG: hypothetical protein K2X35_05155 [Bryobacteraceae bacterium]|nr:hypothetical protein [Bryobacteraceae bacterium]